ncbi:hypothetical protein OU798_17220 [Prolixibacteraceae bacterium Z1-6]|uniref:Uncharacterized protein n=1 Tax=Draconibacterium aestuarii TaxID=2998507 RepID=A0A9X3J7K8_9BACT|nr:hypothetical protein [Prolixibacteraceae bacterium Z1-6]
MTALQLTYNKIIQEHPNLIFESYPVVKLVNDYRLYWKPQRVKTILFAESHVFTNEFEIAFKHNLNLPGYPNSYVRFVYNLAYGQSNTLRESVSNNGGTPQFWKLFNEIAGHKFRVVNNQNPKDKLEQKIQLLQFLKDSGVWLLDCSIVGLYQNGQKPSINDMNDILVTSYLNYCKPVLLEEQPENILVIGKSVYSLFQLELKQLNAHVDWIHQPNARVTSDKRRDINKINFNCI